MHRYCRPTNGAPKASKEALQLWSTDEGRNLTCIRCLGSCRNLNGPAILITCSGDKLRDLLKTHGSFDVVEVHLKKYVKKTGKEGKKGKWVTKAFLIEKQGYTKNLGHSCNSYSF